MHAPFRRLLAAVVLTGLAVPALSAAPAAPGKGDNPVAATRKVLDEVGDMSYQQRTLTDVLTDLKERLKIAITLDPVVTQFGINPNLPTVTVSLKQVKLRDGLRAVLAPYNLRFGLVREGLYVSTEEGLLIRQVRQRVTVDCDGTPFATAAKQLAAETGANVILDPRLKDKAAAAVTLKLDDVPLETAVRLLAEVGDLRVVRMNNVLFVTTPERAEKLRPDADGPVPSAPLNPFFPGGLNPPPVAFRVGGAALPAPATAPAPPPPAPAPLAPPGK